MRLPYCTLRRRSGSRHYASSVQGCGCWRLEIWQSRNSFSCHCRTVRHRYGILQVGLAAAQAMAWLAAGRRWDEELDDETEGEAGRVGEHWSMATQMVALPRAMQLAMMRTRMRAPPTPTIAAIQRSTKTWCGYTEILHFKGCKRITTNVCSAPGEFYQMARQGTM